MHESADINYEYNRNGDSDEEESKSKDDASGSEEASSAREKRFWELSDYAGIELMVGAGDGRMYTFILRDEVPRRKRDDGRERAGISWEVEFTAPGDKDDGGREGPAETAVWLPWSDFKATYRGREKKDAGSLKVGRIRRIGIMMRR